MAAAVLMTATAASAQFKFGVKAGANMANMSNMKYSGYDSKARIGFVVGAFAEYSLSEKFALTGDVLYSQQGNVLKFKEAKGKEISKYDYINVPILANYYIVEGLAVKAGIQPGFVMSAKWKSTDYAEKENNGKGDINKKSYESFDLSIPVGLSYELPMGLVLDARYAIGMTKVNKVSGKDIKDTKNGVASLTVGYKF